MVTQKPLARSEGLVVEELGDELLIYDLKAHRGHSLSAEAARVWKRCDGATPVEGLIAQLDLHSDTVDRALDELDGCGLLEATPELAGGHTRRELTVRMAKVGAAVSAMPLIVSVLAPTPAMAATLSFCRSSCGGGPAGCTTSGCGDCCKPEFDGCCCCDPGDGSIKDCVPADCGDAFCKSLRGAGAHCSCGAAHC